MESVRIGFGLCGSFCTFQKAFAQMKQLVEKGYTVLPVMSDMAYRTDTRFGSAADWIAKIETLCQTPVRHTIVETEPFGPKKLVDIMVVCPCTGNTAAKLASGITDTPITMAVKSCLRNQIPIVLSLASNDALLGSAKNIGALLQRKYIYFTPLAQDDCQKKPSSLVADFSQLEASMLSALRGEQLQPILF